MMKLFIFGLGYSAAAIGSLLRKEGWPITGTLRSPAQFDAIKAQGFVPLLFGDKARVKDALSEATHCLVSVPPSETGDAVLETYESALRSAPRLSWIGYLSTIGVYGGLDGGWADEETPAGPATGRGAARIEAENAWTGLCRERGVPLDIFRLGGIYGPGRSPFERIRAGTARRIVKPGQVFNRIHVADIAQTVVAAMNKGDRLQDVRLFNVTDDEPAPPQDVLLYAAELIGAPPPPEIPFEKADLSPMARSFYAGNKRMRNDKIKRELGIRLFYPTYREGLRDLAKLEDLMKKPAAPGASK